MVALKIEVWKAGQVAAGTKAWEVKIKGTLWEDNVKLTQIDEGKVEYYGLNCVPKNSYVEILTPSTSESDCIWRQGL